MIQFGEYRVKSVTLLTGEDTPEARAILQRADCADVVIDGDLNRMPVVGSWVRLGWDAE